MVQGPDLGNINFGYAGAAVGFPLAVLLLGAGIAQIFAGTWTWQSLLSSYGDDLRDQLYIEFGYNLYKYHESEGYY